ncbi:MAG: hypothetical protein LBU76_07785 [Azoarcus sp.]|jgi:hypothetical protein|nr:hypothetical protein [Azoarcus sp.]
MKNISNTLLRCAITLLIIFSITVTIKYVNNYYVKKNFTPIEAKIIFSVKTKPNRKSVVTKLTVEYIFNNKKRISTIIAPIYDYKKGENITIYINPKNEKDIRIP